MRFIGYKIIICLAVQGRTLIDLGKDDTNGHGCS